MEEKKTGAILGKVTWPETVAAAFWNIYEFWRRC
jgi:hypothetical protein